MADLLRTALQAALDAGAAILRIYGRDFSVARKEDRSPLTAADTAAHHIICAALEPSGLPVLSEESKTVAYEQRRKWTRFWLVDPLDGTKEFIKKNGEFTVNIALIENGRPVLGVVYAPVLQIVYYGMVHGAEGIEPGAWKAGNCVGQTADEILRSSSPCPLPPAPCAAPLRVVASRSHMNPETETFIAELEVKYGAVELVSSGSSLKLCRVAEGSADIYPRIAPTMEWDTAAAQAVVEAAGGRVVAYDPAVPAASYWMQSAECKAQSPKAAMPSAPCPMLHALCPLLYNKETLLNPSFVATGGSRT